MATDAERLAAFDWVAGIYGEKELSRDNVADELHDYRIMIDNVPSVYDHITNGRLTKPTYASGTVISVANDHIDDLINEALREQGLEADEYLAEELVRDQHGPSFWKKLTDEGREYYVRRYTDAIKRAAVRRATEAAS